MRGAAGRDIGDHGEGVESRFCDKEAVDSKLGTWVCAGYCDLTG
jgi:hypothetical protein